MHTQIENKNEKIIKKITIENKKTTEKTNFILIEKENLESEYAYIKFKDGYLKHDKNLFILSDNFDNTMQYKNNKKDVMNKFLALFSLNAIVYIVAKINAVGYSLPVFTIINMMSLYYILNNEDNKKNESKNMTIYDYINVDKIEIEKEETIQIKNIDIEEYFINKEKEEIDFNINEIKEIDFNINQEKIHM